MSTDQQPPAGSSPRHTPAGGRAWTERDARTGTIWLRCTCGHARRQATAAAALDALIRHVCH